MRVIDETTTERFSVFNADTVEVARDLPSDSVDYSIFSPPFASLFTYSPLPEDLGNCRSYEEFWAHYAFLIREQFRVMKPGRLLTVHCMDLPTSKTHDGFIGIRDFRGDIIRAYTEAGFIFHSPTVVWKDPVTAMQRTKALGLLYKQLRKDSAMSRQGLPDYLVTFRKPGENAAPVTKTEDGFPVSLWQRYASPVWWASESVVQETCEFWQRSLAQVFATKGAVDSEGFYDLSDRETADPSSGIDQTNTLNVRAAKEHDDERHLCPLQIGVIRRAVRLWTNPDDVVWSPFTGIGSEGWVSLQEGRRFVGAELKSSYYRQAVRNLQEAATVRQGDLFGAVSA